MTPPRAETVRRALRRFHRWEVALDGAVHVCAILAGVAGAAALLVLAIGRGGAADIAAAGIYSGGLLAMFGCSAAFNLTGFERPRPLLRTLDQAAIFIMIAGTYTPFTLLHMNGPSRVIFTSLVWGLAAAGIVLRLVLPRLFNRISVLLYLALGWMCLAALPVLFHAVGAQVLILLVLGGALYTVGVLFHLWERLPFQKAIWHVFVAAAAAVHYAAVLGGFRWQ